MVTVELVFSFWHMLGETLHFTFFFSPLMNGGKHYIVVGTHIKVLILKSHGAYKSLNRKE